MDFTFHSLRLLLLLSQNSSSTPTILTPHPEECTSECPRRMTLTTRARTHQIQFDDCQFWNLIFFTSRTQMVETNTGAETPTYILRINRLVFLRAISEADSSQLPMMPFGYSDLFTIFLHILYILKCNFLYIYSQFSV